MSLFLGACNGSFYVAFSWLLGDCNDSFDVLCLLENASTMRLILVGDVVNDETLFLYNEIMIECFDFYFGNI